MVLASQLAALNGPDAAGRIGLLVRYQAVYDLDPDRDAVDGVDREVDQVRLGVRRGNRRLGLAAPENRPCGAVVIVVVVAVPYVLVTDPDVLDHIVGAEVSKLQPDHAVVRREQCLVNTESQRHVCLDGRGVDDTRLVEGVAYDSWAA